MQHPPKHSGLALLCNHEGIITQLIRNDYSVLIRIIEERHFSSLFDKWNVANAIDFLMQVKASGIVTDHQISLKVNKNELTLNFSGLLVDDKLLIVGTQKTSDSVTFLEQLQQINNEQANQIRLLIKHKHSADNLEFQQDTLLFDELSRLNNDLVNLQRELFKKNIELTRLSEEKNQFLGIAAHDMRNPLGVVMAYAEFLLDDSTGLSPEKKKVFLTTIYSSASFLLKLIEDLLDLTQIESGKLNLDKSASDLVELAEKCVELNNSLSAKKQIQISLECNKKPIIAIFDPHKIEQVFNNLLTNAVKYSYPGSKVRVAIAADDKKVKVEIIDHGIGISQENLNAIFIPFGNATNKGTLGEKSTGLGLSIVRRIVEGHSGSIFVESTPGKGSVFSFDLPLFIS